MALLAVMRQFFRNLLVGAFFCLAQRRIDIHLAFIIVREQFLVNHRLLDAGKEKICKIRKN
jgi:hypothetical protein